MVILYLNNMYEVDIHSNKETVDVALYNLKIAINMARKEKDRLLKVVVGYGSTGKTHKIKTSVIDILEEYKNNKFIKDYLLGENIDIFNVKYQNFKGKDLIPDKEKSPNKGIILIFV